VVGDGAVTIGSLNLHCGLGGDGRPFDVPQAIKSLSADIVAVQETWRTDGGTDDVDVAARDIGAQVIRAEVRGCTTLADLAIGPQRDRGSWGIAVLSTLPVTAWETVDLGHAPGDVASRPALICSVTTRAGWPLRLVGTHLTHRFTSPVQLYRLARHLARSPVPTVIAGDLNMPRPLTVAGRAAAGFAPTVRGATFPAHRPLLQLDHLLAGRGVAWSAAQVLPSVGSDHRPVLATFRRAAI
jgi:endonuclease/exonuclease/phosphatase family metal-dependent hydrolase